MIVAEAAGFGNNKCVSGEEDGQAVLNFAHDLRGENAQVATRGGGDVTTGEDETATAEGTGTGGGTSPEVFGDGVGLGRIVSGIRRAKEGQARRNGGGERGDLTLRQCAATAGSNDNGSAGNLDWRGWRRMRARSGTSEGDGESR